MDILKNNICFVRDGKLRTNNSNAHTIHRTFFFSCKKLISTIRDSHWHTALTQLLRNKCIFKITLVSLLLSGLWFIGQGTYIHAKAVLAQLLLETAWSQTLDGQKEVKPWPWADTWPIARLKAPDLEISRIVLAGANGSSLAFGPGHLFGSASPGENGNIIISGHRDTHFSFLENLKTGDPIELQSYNKTTSYRINETVIIDKEKINFIPTDTGNKLILITCYPFNAIQAGGSLRYLVIAEPVQAATLS